MSHMVIYRGSDGSPGYHQADEVHDAVAFVEKLRNDSGVEEARIYRMEQVNFEYRPYFRVELTTGEAALSSAPNRPAVEAPASPGGPVAAASNDAPPAVSTMNSAPSVSTSDSGPSAAPGEADADGTENGVGARRGLFGR